MPKFIMALAAAFLLGVTIAGCADQFKALEAQLSEQTKKLDSKPSDIWRQTAERGGE
jgi:outer membrane murein-binding lipoprotein Lpp